MINAHYVHRIYGYYVIIFSNAHCVNGLKMCSVYTAIIAYYVYSHITCVCKAFSRQEKSGEKMDKRLLLFFCCCCCCCCCCFILPLYFFVVSNVVDT